MLTRPKTELELPVLYLSLVSIFQFLTQCSNFSNLQAGEQSDDSVDEEKEGRAWGLMRVALEKELE